MKRWVLFLPGTYSRKNIKFYQNICNSARLVAVDGGCRFFEVSGMTPDYIIGDLDSAKKIPRRIREKTKIIRFPIKKDKTDLQLAFEHCLDHGAKIIDIVNPEVGQVDHFLGNLMLLGLFNKKLKAIGNSKVRIINVDYEILWLHNARRIFTSCAGDRLSVIPMSTSIKLTCRGTEYSADHLQIKRGHTQSLRNQISAQKATIEIEGEALVVHYFSKPN